MTHDELVRRVQFLSVSCVALIGFAVVTLLAAFAPSPSAGGHGSATIEADTLFAEVLVASQIEIIDRGVKRVHLGGQLPDAVIDGERVPRGGTAAGILLFDATGQERSGYVTFDQAGTVLLTLDSRDGQNAFFVADSSGATALRIWDATDAVDLRTDEDGGRISVVRDNRVVLQMPEAIEPDSSTTCSTLRDLRSEYSQEQVLAACRTRMTGAWCQACLN